MKKINWGQKLTSRKFWAAVVGFVTALLLGVLGAVTLSAVITVPDWETARADLLIGMQYETTGLDLDAVPGWLAALVMLHQNFPLDGWAPMWR